MAQTVCCFRNSSMSDTADRLIFHPGISSMAGKLVRYWHFLGKDVGKCITMMDLKQCRQKCVAKRSLRLLFDGSEGRKRIFLERRLI